MKVYSVISWDLIKIKSSDLWYFKACNPFAMTLMTPNNLANSTPLNAIERAATGL